MTGFAAGGVPERGRAKRATPRRARPGPSADDIFHDLGDAEKVKFSQEEIAAEIARLDKLLSDLDQLQAAVDDPDGLVSLTLGFDGRLLEIQLAEDVGHVLSNLELEQRLNGLFAAGTQGVDEMRNDLI